MEQIVNFDEHGDGVITGDLVRCRECRWFGEFCDEYKQESRKDGMCEHPKLGRNTVCTVFDFYCADGERGEQDG